MESVIDKIYPLTIVRDRYNGAYSNGEYTAWNLDIDEMPQAIAGDDVECHNFWLNNDIPVGKGDTITAAYLDLYLKL